MTATYIPSQGDIIWLDLDPVKGNEMAKRRPVVVLSPKSYNEKTRLCVCSPVTSRVKGYPFEVVIPEGLPVSGVVLADQVRTLSLSARNPEFVCSAFDLYLRVVFALEPLLFPSA